jgi:uncharacterized membrane protein HdeD (DUF308 family)
MGYSSTTARVVAGFVAGFLATLVFHQLTAALLVSLGLSPNLPYQMRPVPPLGVPQVLSLAFWGGVWGILYPFLLPRLPRALPGWGWALLIGALGPTLVGWFVVAPLKGLPMMQGGNPTAMVRGLVVNGMWGLGTYVFLRAFARLPGVQRAT